jgi:hypothetical protein
MSSSSTTTRAATAKTSQPSFWKHYSPRGECPISFAGSVLLHALVPLAVVFVVVWGTGVDGEKSKPVQMDVVEIEGLGGGLGGDSVGIGKLDTGKAGRTEGASNTVAPKGSPNLKIDDIKLRDLPKVDIALPTWEDSLEAKDGNILAYLERERKLGEQIIASEARAAATKPGGTGGPKGQGLGNNPKGGPAKGNSPTGSVLTDQRRRELRWKILASEDGDVHLKKLQALRVVLVLPLRSRPGFALRYDLSKPMVKGEEMRFTDDSNKVRWQNSDPKEMLALAKVLRLKEVPPVSLIYLPSELEADMARRELAYQGRQENEIKETVWDVRERDGGFENEPYIVQQFLRAGVK